MLQQKHLELKYKEQQLELANCILQRHVETLVNEKEEQEKEAMSLYSALKVIHYQAFKIGFRGLSYLEHCPILYKY